MKINKYITGFALTIFVLSNIVLTLTGYASPVDWTIQINGHSEVTQVEGQEVVNKIEPIIDSLTQSIVNALNGIEEYSVYTNNGQSGAQIGTPLNINLRLDIGGYIHFVYTLHDLEADIHFVHSILPDLDVLYHAPIWEISGFIDPDSQAVHDLAVNTPGDTIEVFLGGMPIPLDPAEVEEILNSMEQGIIDHLSGGGGGELSLITLLHTLLGDLVKIEDPQSILGALMTPGISTQDITLLAELDHLTGELDLEINYEQPYAGILINQDMPPIRGMMFSSFNIQATKQSLGFTGGDLSHYDDVYTDEEKFFQLMDSLNIKFIRSDIDWQRIESQLDPLTLQIDDYISNHAQVFDNIEVHFQLANQYLYDFLVTIADGHSVPRDPQTNKLLWIGYENDPTEEDLELGYNTDDYVFTNRGDYLAAIERHIRAVVRRLKHVINFWQVENELNQADLGALANVNKSFRRHGSAWAHVGFLDELMQTMTNSIKQEDDEARIIHNFHPFRISKIQDWEQYLDIIGLTYHPNIQFAFPLLGIFMGDFVKIAYYFLDGPSKPVWILSTSYPAMFDGGNANWDFSKDFDTNFADYNTERQVLWISDALSSSGSAQAESFLYRTYQAHVPFNPPSTRPNDHAGLIYPDGTPKASHDRVINSLKTDEIVASVSGPDSLPPGESGIFTVIANGGICRVINGISQYDFYRWERKDLEGDWEQIVAGDQVASISQGGDDHFWLRCEVTDYYEFKQMSDSFLVIVDEAVSIGPLTSGRRIPNETRLIGNYPNPFNPVTKIEFDLSKESQVSLRVFNLLGEEIATLVSDRLPSGNYTFEWTRPVGLASGVYLYRLDTDNFTKTRKMLLIQ